jgi:hypothetical protein
MDFVIAANQKMIDVEELIESLSSEELMLSR